MSVRQAFETKLQSRLFFSIENATLSKTETSFWTTLVFHSGCYASEYPCWQTRM